MASNIEWKARVRDFAATRELTRRSATDGPQVLQQRDTYFATTRGRLKLREYEDVAELIGYHRADRVDIRRSEYTIVPIVDPIAAKNALECTLGIETVVQKRREVWWVDNIRIHLDQVERLGDFLELEAVMGPNHEDAERETVRVQDLALQLKMGDAVAIAGSYRDLMMQSTILGP